ncbi:GntR family transcriptional regulator [Ferrovibrio sp. MS7]|uniref:GntR family transcriptional regulator n=1 Tax=Ferrovibrio plantarum TaxID=3119164 RepID=UPI003135E7DD
MPSDDLRGVSEAPIRQRILQAIFERRLQPGEKLTEERLAELFGVSRTVVRQALARLAQDGIVVQRPNKGASVAAPSRLEARQVLAVRQMVEPEIAAEAARLADTAGLRRLRKHLEAENAARRSNDRATLVRLTGEFHMVLADVAGNPILVRLLTELQALTCLAILLYARGDDSACHPDEHEQIVAAIIAKDGATAAAIMRRHLEHVEHDMDLNEPAQRGNDLASALGMPAKKRSRG